MVQPVEIAVVRKTTLFLFHTNRFWFQTPGEVNIFYSLRYFIIDYYIHYNIKSMVIYILNYLSRIIIIIIIIIFVSIT